MEDSCGEAGLQQGFSTADRQAAAGDLDEPLVLRDFGHDFVDGHTVAVAHVPGVGVVAVQAAERAPAEEEHEQIRAAVLGRSADEAVRVLMTAWREYVLAQPHRYSALEQTPHPMVAQAGERLVEIILAVLHA